MKHGRQLGAQLDAAHARPACSQRGGRLAGADLGVSRRESDVGQLGDVIEQFGGVRRPGSVYSSAS